MRHGTATGYRTYGCRCSDCRTANTAAQRQYRIKLLDQRYEAIPHGLNGYDNYGCRCEPCRQAKSAANRRYREENL